MININNRNLSNHELVGVVGPVVKFVFATFGKLFKPKPTANRQSIVKVK